MRELSSFLALRWVDVLNVLPFFEQWLHLGSFFLRLWCLIKVKIDHRGQSLVLSVVHKCSIEVLRACLAERTLFLVDELFVQAAQESLIVNAHGLQEVHLELLPVTAELRCESVALALQILLGDLELTQLIECLLTFKDL